MALVPPLHIVGVPFNSAGLSSGVARAPTALRRAGLIEKLEAVATTLVDRGDVQLGRTSPTRHAASHVIAPGALASMIVVVRAEVEAALDAGAFPLVVGGDCPVLLGCLGARSLHAPRGLIFVDGHEDAWPPALSTTGEAADMELGFGLGLTLGGLPERLVQVLPRLDANAVVVIGPRDAGELATAGVPSVRDVVAFIGPEALANHPRRVAEDAVGRLADRGDWWLHVDLDVLSTESLSAVDYRLPGGIDWDQLTEFTRRLLAAPGVIGWDVTIYNPDLDPDGEGARRIVRYLADSLEGRLAASTR